MNLQICVNLSFQNEKLGQDTLFQVYIRGPPECISHTSGPKLSFLVTGSQQSLTYEVTTKLIWRHVDDKII
jgi:hypothetical protein